MTSTYDPSYCLQEHLNYFQENVAFDIAADDFDVVFANSECTYHNPPTISKPSAPYVVIEQVFIVPNPLPKQDDRTSPAPFVSSSSTIPCSPTSVRQLVPDPTAAPVVEIAPKFPQVTEEYATSSAVNVTLPPSSLVISDDESAPEFSGVSAPTSPVLSDQFAAPSPVLSDDADEVERLLADLPPPPLTNTTTIASHQDSDGSNEGQAPKKYSRKRRMSSTDGPDVRRERNRLHARKSRERKKEFHQCLQESVEALKDENEWLLSVLNKKCILNGEQSVSAPIFGGEEDFIAGLQNPENRVLSDEALIDLQSLFQS